MENLSGNLKMYVESDVQININNLTISGEKKREAQKLVGKNLKIIDVKIAHIRKDYYLCQCYPEYNLFTLRRLIPIEVKWRLL